jgi:hypothetical protein
MTETEVEVCLDFDCHACRGPIGLIVICKGALLTLTNKVLLRTTARCPHCGKINEPTFDPDGAVYDVSPWEDTLPQPSLN